LWPAEGFAEMHAMYPHTKLIYIISDPNGFFRQLYAFLGLEFKAPDENRQANKSDKLDFDVAEKELFELLRPTYTRFGSEEFGPIPSRWRERIDAFS
jgi:hypothetical protein